MQTPTITKRIRIVEGSLADYHALSRFHYRGNRPGPIQKIYAARLGNILAGVIVYSMSMPMLTLRNHAIGDYFLGMDNHSLISLVNKTVRTISRVIVEPRFRGIGLAVRMVRETMPLINMPMVEALTVMGHANPFFEKAGMKPYKAPPSAQTIRIAEALSLVGIEDELYIDAEATHKHIEDLPSNKKLFIEREMERFLQSYRKQRHMPDRLERTRFLLSKLTDRPIYYLWLNKLLVG